MFRKSTLDVDDKILLMNEKMLQILKLIVEGQARSKQGFHMLSCTFGKAFRDLSLVKERKILRKIV